MKLLTNNVCKTREQWGKLLLYGAIGAGISIVGNKYPILGDLTGVIIGGAVLSPMAVYVARVSRYFQNVRFKIPKYIKTGDGGDNYFSVITRKYWNPFWKAPLDHLKLPILANETIIDVGGSHVGGVFSGKRPLSAIASNEKNCFPIPSNAWAGPDASERYEELKNKPLLNEDESCELEGLRLFEQAGVRF